MSPWYRPDRVSIKRSVLAAFIVVTACASLRAVAENTATDKVTQTSTLTPDKLALLANTVCLAGEATTEQLAAAIGHSVNLLDEPIHFRQTEIGNTVTATLKSTSARLLEIQFLQPPGRPAQTNVTSYITSPTSNSVSTAKPDTRLTLTSDCEIRSAHQLVYDIDQKTQLYVAALDANLQATGEKQWLNPQLPELPETPSDAIKVGLIDSGVNYLLPEIKSGLSTDAQGNLNGFDFWDMDNRPYDANPARSPFFVQRHGTRTASIVLREAPGVKLVPYRYPRHSMARMIDLIQHANELGIKVIGMPLGSNTYADWTDFESAAKEHPHILFIVSAGNNGRDIDTAAVYPAAMDLKNMLVVTSADDFVHPAERTNYGRMSVDYLVPAEHIRATDFNGDSIKVSGSSYAVARVLALAARLLQQNPDRTIADIQSAIRDLSVRAETSRFVSIGYLGDPLAMNDQSNLHITTDDPTQFTGKADKRTKYSMPLRLIKLDTRWNNAALKTAIAAANRLYQQCDIKLEVESIVSLTAPDYLQDLSSGHALTLARATGMVKNTTGSETVTRVFLARDTVMLDQYDANAFGLGNTRNRPWMTNSLWLTFGITDTDIALAHELFHIMSNSGEHSTRQNNLMQNRTDPDNTMLTEDQCAGAIENGITNGILRKYR